MILHNKKCLFYQYILGSLEICSRMNHRIPHRARLPYIHEVPCADFASVTICAQMDYKHELGGLCKNYGRPNLGCIWKLGFAAWQRTQ